MRIRKNLGDLTELKRSIQELGQLHPCIFTPDGVLISGERRYTACKELGIEPLIRVLDFKNPEHLIQAEIQENTIRKDFQPSEIYDIYRFYSKKISKQGQRLRTENGQSERPIELIARLTGYHRDTISKINNIYKYGTDEIKKQVDEGKISISKANNQVLKHTRILSKIEKLEEVSKTFSSEDIKILYGDFYEYSKTIPDEYFDALITDPPYEEKYFHLWEKMFEVAEKKLKPSKFLIFYFSPMHLDKIFKIETSLRYYWSFKLDFKRPYLNKPRNIMSTYKLVLFFEKPPMKLIPTVSTDIIDEKEFNYQDRLLHSNNWQQGIEGFEFLIDKFTNPGDLIWDPMAGTGTTLLACQRLKRRAIGCEIDKKYKPIIEGRLSIVE